MKLFSKILILILLTQSNVFAETKTLNMRLSSDPVSLDWNGLSTFVEAPIILNLCEGLNQIAESITRSKNSKEYIFKIRTDAKWSDGRRVLAQDFVDSWLRLLSPQSTSIYTYYLFDIENAREYHNKSVTSSSDVGIKAVDASTLRVRLKRAVKNWETNTAFWPLFPIRLDQIEKYGTNWWRAGVLISNGPFVYDSYEAGKKAILKRNPFYRKSGSNIGEVDIYFMSNEDDVLKKYDNKFFPFLWSVPFSLTKKYRSSSDFQFQNIMRGHLLGLNIEKFPMSNKEFRLAVLSAINPKKLISSEMGQLKPGETLIPPPLPGSEHATILPFDPKAAKEHLKNSGIILNKTKLRILASIIEPFNSIGKMIQSQLMDNLGIDVELSALPNQELTAYINLGDYNATLLSWTAKVLSPQDFLLPYSGEAEYNRMHFKSSFYDQWIFEGIQASSPKEAAKAFTAAQKVIAVDEAVLSPLFFEKGANLVRSNVKNLKFNHMGIPLLKDVYLK